MKRRLAESFAIGNYSASMSRPPTRKLNNVEMMGFVSGAERIPVRVKTPNEFDKTRRQLRTARKDIGQLQSLDRNVWGKVLKTVRREKALVHSGRQTRPGTGSLHPVAIEAAAEVTKPLEPSV
jgi:hypothetical protein